MDIALICAPFAAIDRPSIGLSILQSHITQAKFNADVHYLNIDYVEHFGISEYQELANGAPEKLQGEQFISDIERKSPLMRTDDEEKVALWHKEKAKELVHCEYDIYAFSCLFQQIRSSLWIAEEIKKLSPNSIVVFGGASLDTPMGNQLFASFNQIDYLFQGESEFIFLDLIKHLNKGSTYQHKSVLNRNTLILTNSSPNKLENLDDSLLPDYSNFFKRYKKSPISLLIKPFVFYETSRGCSWGAKKQCTFCGLNAGTMAYRQKSSSKVLDEIKTIIDNYGSHIDELAFVDNIMPDQYYKTLLPELAKLPTEVSYFYEIKSNITYKKLLALKQANVLRIQPGIESLSTQILKCMDKGVSALQNVVLLVNSARLNIDVDWNILLNIPGELETSLREMLDLIPALMHLQPPDASCSFRLDRYSPIFMDPDKFELKNIRPVVAYSNAFPELKENEIFNLAYHFEYEDTRTDVVISLHNKIQSQIALWKSKTYSLYHQIIELGLVSISDNRNTEHVNEYVLTAPESLLYTEIVDHLDSIRMSKLKFNDNNTMDSLINKKLVMIEFDRVLALSIERVI